MSAFLNRHAALCHYILGSLPLLLILAVIRYHFANETEVMLWFKAHAHAHPDIRKTALLITDWGNALFYPVYLWFLITGIRQRRKYSSRLRFALVYLVVQLSISLLLVRFMKIAIGRPRPGEGPLFEPFSGRGAYHSLPSGHTTEIYGAALPLVLRYRQFLLTLILGIFAAAVAFSRIYLSWHHPSDVFCGWMLGSVAGFAIHLFSRED
ncbi:phosphatase PAP2 family protein [Maridesulfovibrio sp.]|uniref:phosphatase PAP2 family protein n=1 Tax=Maridesulfovibrio sp. TaxID=2795000 RepID=UPI002A1872DF|nr:phosphatase PAP2 family protein [Maridesulfovibrio sp.]